MRQGLQSGSRATLDVASASIRSGPSGQVSARTRPVSEAAEAPDGPTDSGSSWARTTARQRHPAVRVGRLPDEGEAQAGQRGGRRMTAEGLGVEPIEPLAQRVPSGRPGTAAGPATRRARRRDRARPPRRSSRAPPRGGPAPRTTRPPGPGARDGDRAHDARARRRASPGTARDSGTSPVRGRAGPGTGWPARSPPASRPTRAGRSRHRTAGHCSRSSTDVRVRNRTSRGVRPGASSERR